MNDDDPADDWKAPDDTDIELDQDDLDELAVDAARTRMDTPGTAPHHTLDWLAGYEAGARDGNRRGAARVLRAVRKQLLADGAHPDIARAILRSLATQAGVKLS